MMEFKKIQIAHNFIIASKIIDFSVDHRIAIFNGDKMLRIKYFDQNNGIKNFHILLNERQCAYLPALEEMLLSLLRHGVSSYDEENYINHLILLDENMRVKNENDKLKNSKYNFINRFWNRALKWITNI